MKNLQDIWDDVPPDYYQKSVSENPMQKIWHKNRIRAVRNILTKHIGSKKHKKLLDVGCASGWFLSQLLASHPQLTYSGIDVYKDGIRYAKKNYPDIRFGIADAHKLPYKNASFDVVICMNVLEHAVDPKTIVKEIKRVAKKDAIVIIGMDSENTLFKLTWTAWKLLKGRVWKHAHLHAFSIKNLEKLFKECGFAIEEKAVFNYTMSLVHTLRKKGED